MKNLLLVGGLALSVNLFSQNSISQDNLENRVPGFTANSNSSATITELPEGFKLHLYPNPASESFEVIHPFEDPIEMLTLRDNNGRRIRTYEKPKPEKFFIADIPSGVYGVEITIGDYAYLTKLIIP